MSDQEIGDSFLDVPVGLSDDRSASALTDITNNAFGENIENPNVSGSSIDHNALALFNSPALPGEPGKWLIPNDALGGIPPTITHLDNAFLPGTGRFTADLAVADIDYNATKKDTLQLEVLLPARSDHLAVLLFERARILRSTSTPARRLLPSPTATS